MPTSRLDSGPLTLLSYGTSPRGGEGRTKTLSEKGRPWGSNLEATVPQAFQKQLPNRRSAEDDSNNDNEKRTDVEGLAAVRRWARLNAYSARTRQAARAHRRIRPSRLAARAPFRCGETALWISGLCVRERSGKETYRSCLPPRSAGLAQSEMKLLALDVLQRYMKPDASATASFENVF